MHLPPLFPAAARQLVAVCPYVHPVTAMTLRERVTATPPAPAPVTPVTPVTPAPAPVTPVTLVTLTGTSSPCHLPRRPTAYCIPLADAMIAPALPED